MSHPPWLIVAGGFTFHAGQDKAVASLADYLARQGVPLQLVGNKFDPTFLDRSGVTLHHTPLPGGVQTIANVFTARVGRAVAKRLMAKCPSARVVVNGGNCQWADVNWVHYLHHAWQPITSTAPAWHRLKTKLFGTAERAKERRAVNMARLVIANSQRTKDDIVRHLGTPADRVKVVYYGADPGWVPPTAEERLRAKAEFGVPDGRPVVTFVGGFGHDSRKGFDTLLSAWAELCRDQAWDGVLLMAGSGPAASGVGKRVHSNGLGDRVRLLGHIGNVRQLLAAADLLVSPVRYEAYGLNVQEAIARGVPAVVSAVAGVVEHYPPDLAGLIIQNPDDVGELIAVMRLWRDNLGDWAARMRGASELIRSRFWDDMASEFVAAVEASPSEVRLTR